MRHGFTGGFVRAGRLGVTRTVMRWKATDILVGLL